MLGLIPRAAINGVLIYVGMEGLLSTSLWTRVCLLISPRTSFPQRLAALGVPRVHLFTVMQLGLLGGCWLINLSPLGLCVAQLSPEPSPYPDPYPDPEPDSDPDPDPDPYPHPHPHPHPRPHPNPHPKPFDPAPDPGAWPSSSSLSCRCASCSCRASSPTPSCTRSTRIDCED